MLCGGGEFPPEADPPLAEEGVTPKGCHPEPEAKDPVKTGILRGVYPEQSRRAQNDICDVTSPYRDCVVIAFFHRRDRRDRRGRREYIENYKDSLCGLCALSGKNEL
jgi:hypothetical protein